MKNRKTICYILISYKIHKLVNTHIGSALQFASVK